MVPVSALFPGIRATEQSRTDTTPQEQFSEEWDYVPNCPHNSTRPSQKPKAAGRYGWETNLYQLALASPPHPDD